jgi:hypothetical protein
MKITTQTELMQNQKHAVVMAPDLAFEALQTQDGDALFFSIGTDNVLYLTREVDQDSTGWNRLDLSSALSAQHGGAAVTAKTFAVAQNAQTLGIDLALVLTAGGQDFLYLALGHANTDAAWANGATWTAVPFDAGTAPAPLTIADVFAMNMSVAGGTGGVENIFVDIVRKPGDPLKLLDRYYIAPGGSPQWNLHKLAIDLAAGSIASCLGQRTGDPVPGIYTFGTISTEQELIFAPQYNFFQPTIAPSPARLTLPAGATAIASALNSAGASNLFVAATGGLYLFAPGNQHDQATAVQVLPTSLITGASELAASSGGGRTAVWWVNPQGNLMYTTCAEGNEATTSAWSAPVPILLSAEKFAFYLNLGAGSGVLFADVNGQDLVRLSQDPVTTDWQQRSIVLPPTTPGDVITYDSYTTQVQVTDANGIGVPDATLTVTATSPVSVYLNDVYYLLSPTVPVTASADITGALTIIEETQSLAGVCIHLVLASDTTVTADVNPLSKPLAIMGTVHTGSDLAVVQVTNADGSQQPLVPSSVSAANTAAAAQAIAQFVKIGAGLPQNGSRQQAAAQVAHAASAATAHAAHAAHVAVAAPAWGLSFAGGGLTYHEGTDTAVPHAVEPRAASSPIAVAAGDFFQWVNQVYNDVSSFVVQQSGGLYHFLVTVAGQAYDVVLDCVAAVVHAAELVFAKIMVLLDDLIKWLGFIFEWSDILRTHRVMKNIFTQYSDKAIGDLGTLHTDLQNAFTSATDYIKAWTGIPANPPAGLTSGVDSVTGSSQPAPGMNTPQSNWGLYHLKSSAGDASVSPPGTGFSGDLESILQPLLTALSQEQGVLQGASNSFQNDIIDKIHDLSLTQVIEGVFAIITDALLESVENVLLAAIDVFAALIKGALDLLTMPIDVPVISSVYQSVTGDDLSLLDLICLVAAIPATIGYKLTTGAAPFPDNATTTALTNAANFTSLQQICGTGAAQAHLAGAFAPRATSDSTYDALALVGAWFGLVGGASVSYFTQKKQQLSALGITPGPTLCAIVEISYFGYVAPDIMGNLRNEAAWWASLNGVMSDLMVAKAFLDMMIGINLITYKIQQPPWDEVSAWLDITGNVIWQIPTIGALFDPSNRGTSGYLNFAAGTCSDLAGCLSPVQYFTLKEGQLELWKATCYAVALLNLAYGGLSISAASPPNLVTDAPNG